ncbi:MFS transporter [endosymbiont of Ridgeia piscesae]|jgi:MFS family permease|uniref:Putative arabinose efflux permease, MFS family n=1 Tax=endosymbiont of Ridgeia piscesae TaxID=54398 RepID=A0A0T5YXC6_9GAMM|nr:MFS transporter [endosymbiont of Ridgeia piscesae]KRT55239.1 putative arabinose efflux permease, MFS family [endosymbiont of Ridgeia piscesae]KRT59501.1 putative arabinose efflux permease, MFS family [endosymbiont of Ridgeia piscesae]
MAKSSGEGQGLNPLERRAAFSLAGIFSLRMMGLFLILPVFALYAEDMAGVTPMLVGAAIGVYGLTQAVLQIPFGMLSDRIGRKPVIIAGLLIFACGSAVAASADTIWGIIAGRALQGSGAIAAVIMALAADLSREQRRLRMMAIIGMSIGAAFAVSLVLGPVLNSWIGVPGIFGLTSILALLGVGVVLFVVPTPQKSEFHRDAEAVPGQFGKVLRDPELVRLDLGILILHMTLTALFLAFPLALRDLGMASDSHWQVYLPVMLVAMAAMVPFVIIAESKRKMRPVFIGAVAALALAGLAMALMRDLFAGLVLALLLFFIAFNLLEATLPSLVAKVAPGERKGTAMGVYSSSQFTGAFIGGLLGGWVHSQYGVEGVFLFCGGISTLWLLIAWGMSDPNYLSNFLLPVGELEEDDAALLEKELSGVAGVAQAVVIPEDRIAYLKVDLALFDESALDAYCAEQA